MGTEMRLARLNHLEYLRSLSRWSGRRGELEERDGVLRWATATDFPVTCNGTVRLDRTVPADQVVAAADTWFGARGRGWSISMDEPTGADADLAAAASAAGLVDLHGTPTMVRRSPLRPARASDGIELRWLREGGDPDHFVTVADQAFRRLGMTAGAIEEMCADRGALLEPHLDAVLAHDSTTGEPLACAQLLSHGIAGIFYVGALEHARGRGLGELVTRAVTNRAFERGAAFTSLQATEMGHPVYRRMGYEDVGRYASFVRFAPS